eukprot:1612547-Pyramimonas_sp.AAC.1
MKVLAAVPVPASAATLPSADAAVSSALASFAVLVGPKKIADKDVSATLAALEGEHDALLA